LKLFLDISRLVHLYDYLPIELVSQFITGTSGADDVHHAYSDASWTVRHKSYDDMTPEDVRAAARAVRQRNQQDLPDSIMCSSFAIIASQNSTAHARLSANLNRAVEAGQKRRREALENDDEPPVPTLPEIAMDEIAVEEAEDEDDFMASLGI
jgi:hypothetical protein